MLKSVALQPTSAARKIAKTVKSEVPDFVLDYCFIIIFSEDTGKRVAKFQKLGRPACRNFHFRGSKQGIYIIHFRTLHKNGVFHCISSQCNTIAVGRHENPFLTDYWIAIWNSISATLVQRTKSSSVTFYTLLKHVTDHLIIEKVYQHRTFITNWQ